MIQIGITGGIGSGKSTVRDLLERKGAVLFDADSVAKKCMTTDSAVKNALVQVLGLETYASDGALNKSFIATRIFEDENLRLQVNSIVHPAVYRRYKEAVREADEAGVPAIVRESALLPSAEWRADLDVLVFVDAELARRSKRVERRDQLSDVEFNSRVNAQPSPEEFRAAADIVLNNDGNLADLTVKVDELWSSLHND